MASTASKCRAAICHPDRKHCSKGLCAQCYSAAYVRTEASRARAREYARKRRAADPEASRARGRASYAANREAILGRAKKYSAANKDKIRGRLKVARAKDGYKERRLKGQVKRYGVTKERFEAMFVAQGGLCLICHETNISNRRLGVDHCHATGKVRGLLCGRCNTAIGQLRDRPDLARAAAIYLEVCS